jgi:glycosyltransferase involved in cell wall biosynthesis
LTTLAAQYTDHLFTYSVVVVDNDSEQSARDVATAFSSAQEMPLTYCVEPEQNIALARNQAIKHATGDFIAFIDDDEFPTDKWLWSLFIALPRFGVNGVLGPVLPHFESEPPEWVTRGRFFERPRYATGYRIGWHESRTGNVLFERRILNDVGEPFRSQFATAGEDMDFFYRMIDRGFSFAWCDEAVVYESVPPSRCTRSYLLRRALLRGSNFRKHSTGHLKSAMKSILAVPSYLIALPISALIGHHLFIRYLIKLFDHSSRLLGYLGLSLLSQRQT